MFTLTCFLLALSTLADKNFGKFTIRQSIDIYILPRVYSTLCTLDITGYAAQKFNDNMYLHNWMALHSISMIFDWTVEIVTVFLPMFYVIKCL